MVMPIAQNGITDMFYRQLWNPDDYVSQCQQNNYMTPQFNWALDSFGGRNPNKDFRHVSNIAFTNGDLDPWRAGGLTHAVPGNADILVKVMRGGAHHLELRLPNDEYDPQDVKDARNLITELIVQWIAQYKDAESTAAM
jgi:Serine carboxypeptidase S28